MFLWPPVQESVDKLKSAFLHKFDTPYSFRDISLYMSFISMSIRQIKESDFPHKTKISQFFSLIFKHHFVNNYRTTAMRW